MQRDVPSVAAAQPDLTDASCECRGNHVEALLKCGVNVAGFVEERQHSEKEGVAARCRNEPNLRRRNEGDMCL